ncbi:hypothetical protein [Thermococcus sp. 21S7]|uniref:hypothetical protein n=1 Tax=Thermococcus sp. 21S7 TaxID=1638221 RepID=UPI00143A130E|nr:hypothetical protein [Thermococcus sp. 21S7]NJE60184.1 hypothetical protein [Thermococcus sp. 21S7]
MLLRGVIREAIFPKVGQLNENIRIERPAVILDFVLAVSVEVGDATNEERIITSSLFGRDRVLLGKNVVVVGNVQSNGRIVIGDESTIFGNVVGKEVEIGEGVRILGNVIAKGHVAIGMQSKIGGYAASVSGSIEVKDGVEVFDIFGYSGAFLGQNIHIMDYALYGGRRGVDAEGEVFLGEYQVSSPKAIMVDGSLNLLSVLIPAQYNPRGSLKYLKENLDSIIDIRTYLEMHNIDIGELEMELKIKPIQDALRRMVSEVTQTLSMSRPSITVTNPTAPVMITVGDNNVVSVSTSEVDRHLAVNLVELFQKARKNITEGNLKMAYSSLASIREAASKNGSVPEELEELLRIIRNRVREGVNSPSEDVKGALISLLEAAYNKMLKI